MGRTVRCDWLGSARHKKEASDVSQLYALLGSSLAALSFDGIL